MGKTNERITHTASNILIQELIDAGYGKAPPKSKVNLSRACNYKPTLSPTILAKAMGLKQVASCFIGRIPRYFAIVIVNFLKDKHGVTSKARGILPIKPEQ
tara:strand:+ start:10 stop:312 length:303 start_codon:yes stop_codon:yes gene_type:complete